jgi:NADH-quinone oxidoreductase subunit C
VTTLEQVQQALSPLGTPGRVIRNRVQVGVSPEKIREAILMAQKELAFDHLIQISVADLGKTFQLTYHMTGPHRIILSLAVDVPRERAEAPSLHDILPPAGIYERQIHDLMGIVFTGHPFLKRIILNEDWPPDEFPLRKDWKPDPARYYGGVREVR